MDSDRSISLESVSSGKHQMNFEEKFNMEAIKEERRIQRLMGEDEGSRSASSRSVGSKLSTKSSSGRRDAAMGEEAANMMRLGEKLTRAVQHYADKTAVRAVLYLKMVADPATVLIKSRIQHMIHERQDPTAFIQSIQGLKFVPEYYAHFTDRDKEGIYVLSFIYYYQQYRNVLGPFEKEFVNSMTLELLNSMSKTALFKQYFAFLQNVQEELANFGIDLDEVNRHLTAKFQKELLVLADVFASMPVKITAGGQQFVHTYPDVISLVIGNLQMAHPAYIHHISTYFTNVEAQIRACCIPQGGNNGTKKSRSKKPFKFHFPRFKYVGLHKKYFH